MFMSDASSSANENSPQHFFGVLFCVCFFQVLSCQAWGQLLRGLHFLGRWRKGREGTDDGGTNTQRPQGAATSSLYLTAGPPFT